MQFSSELAHFIHFMKMNDVSSYLEMGANSGRLVSWLHDNFSFQKCGAVSLAPMKYVHDHNKKVASEFRTY